MTVFLLLAALMLAAALAIVLRPLLSRHAPGDPAAAARRRMQALNEAHAAGVLTDEEFAAKRAELGDKLLTAINPTAAPRSRTTFMAAATVALVIPAAALVLYRMVGDPRALDPAALTAAPAQEAPAGHGGEMDQAIAGLAAKLAKNPDDAEGWALLGRAYLETQHFAEGRDALKHAHDLVPGDADLSVALAEAMTLASESHQIDAETRALIDSAMKTDPNNQRGTWLLGVAEYQAGRFDAAIAKWNRLLELLPKDSTVTQSVKDQIARAEAERDGREPPPPTMAPSAASGASSGSTASAPSGAAGAAPRPTASAANASPASAPASTPAAATPKAGTDGGPHLTVKVMLDPALTSKVAPGDTVFVYAKAANGPPMPLAIQRLRADQLPATVVLTDGMGMMPSMRLSQFPQIIIGARVSKSGNAIAQSGDLQTISKPLDVASTAPINLTIDQTVP
jgi:cytochrome c-type biogenesis protein CcmH